MSEKHEMFFFDIDGTIRKGSLGYESREFFAQNGVLSEEKFDEIRRREYIFKDPSISVDELQRVHDEYVHYCLHLLDGISEGEFQKWAHIFIEKNGKDQLFDKVDELFAFLYQLQNSSRHALSNSTHEVVDAFNQHHEFFHTAEGTKIAVQDGIYIPEMANAIHTKEGKGNAVEQIIATSGLARSNVHITVFADTGSDLSMAKKADKVVCINPKGDLEKYARERTEQCDIYSSDQYGKVTQEIIERLT